MYYRNCRYRGDLEEAIQSTVNFKVLFGRTFLITGASGLIASFLIDLLFYANETMQAGIKVYALVRNRECAARRFRSIMEHPDFHLIVQDVCEPLTFNGKADYVIHAAGDGYPKAFREHPVETMLPALVGTWQLLEYIRKIGDTRLLYVSSGEVYGSGREEGFIGSWDRCSRNPGEGLESRIREIFGSSGFTETDSGYVDTMQSRSCYPSAKRAAETLCASYHAEYGVDTVVARLSHVYGPNISEKDNRAAAQFFRDVLGGRDVVLKSQGEQMRSYTYVADCVSAVLTVLIKGTAGEAYNISNPDAKATIAEFAQMTAEAGRQKCLFAVPGRADVQESTPISCAVLNSEKLQGLGWKGTYDVSRGIRHTLEIMKGLDVQDS